ncbi:hypothetical protein BDZ85DRAFT_15869 [Elsinoe ampelina]|uniref:Alpha-ketoglutarate-dependent dioxygenase AlkB-like domain-containing protein n=1 Tax=Elsinoe ampelina TaxID=302913 RepID=A0A6A6G6P2_9PEZI|nr:hypothetical protein BDZ85DRAFT_15869 [Elsinoe ampelina]
MKRIFHPSGAHISAQIQTTRKALDKFPISRGSAILSSQETVKISRPCPRRPFIGRQHNRLLHFRKGNDWFEKIRKKRMMELEAKASESADGGETGREDSSTRPEQNGTGHHDTHALPPLFVQEACWRYNKMKRADLDNDPNIIDFTRGLSEEQKACLKPESSISATTVQAACQAFWQESMHEDFPSTITTDVPIYSHVKFPGLHLIPSLLPPSAQLLFTSLVLHRHLANPLHTTNLTTTHPLTLPPSASSSLFLLPPSSTHTTPPLTTSQLLSSKLRYLTLGTQYHWPTRSYPRSTPTPFPPDLAPLITTLFPSFRPESGVCLLYGPKDFMPVHRDVSEQCARPLASFSFGCDGIFLLARGEGDGDGETRQEREARLLAVRVRSGDVVYLDGESRWAWHAMPRTVAGTGSEWAGEWPVGTPGEEGRGEWERWRGWLKGRRLNVSCRQVWD